MKALVTGASSGIGRDMARQLAAQGYDLILVARRLDRLEQLKKELPGNISVFSCDLSKVENCMHLYEQLKNEDIDVLINNAGFGAFGAFDKLPLEEEIMMLQTNDMAAHVLMKLFLKDFVAKNHGQILNICSSAAFYPGPLMATYYASKAYLYRLSLAVYEELRKQKSHVHISILCPGPIATEFQEVADVKFALKTISSEKCAEIALRGLKRKKLIIIPTFTMKCGKFLARFVTEKMILKISYRFQKRKKH